jgi:murein DD-endopeptidase MepM/ murein hydrolase activator NlpD
MIGMNILKNHTRSSGAYPLNNRFVLPILAALSLTLLILLGCSTSGTPAPTAQPKSFGEQDTALTDQILAEAILEAVVERQEIVLGFLVHEVMVDNFRYSEDGSWGAAWLGYRDPETGEPLPSEPGLALAQREGKEWSVIMPSDAGWVEALQNAPESLIPPEEKESWLLFYERSLASMPQAALTGYLLPWPAGEVRYLSQSVGHDRYTPSGTAHYAFDFYLSGKMWNIYASKAGTVWRVKYDVPTCYEYNCGQTLGNYIVLMDETTTPVSYQLYLHLAYDSIPPAMRVIGAQVLQGQLIGIADNTGQSWGHHLHYQVHTNPASYYGTSVDITFNEVTINGGRPRVSPYDPPYCRDYDICQSFQPAYVSANEIIGDATPPTGDLISPVTGDVISTQTLILAGYAYDDDSGLQSAQFIVNYDGVWQEAGPIFESSPFVHEWDLCAGEVPHGPVSVGMRLRDAVGNLNQLAGIKHFINLSSCTPPPTCLPGAGQAALFKGVDFQDCVLFNTGSYPTGSSLGALGSDAAAALRTASNVLVTVFRDENFSTRGETFNGIDAGLADNLVGIQAVSSMRVELYNIAPLVPVVNLTQNPTNAPEGDLLTLVWENAGGALEYQVQLIQNGAEPQDMPWQDEPYLHLSGLETGQYEWKVRARNQAGESSWSQIAGFEIVEAPAGWLGSLLSVTAPYSDDMEGLTTLWTKTGLWGLKNDSTLAFSGSKSWWYQGSGGDYDIDGQRNYGDLTSPQIFIPETGFYLRFWSRNETEGSGKHWDQRWVQISADGGPFENILQLTDDVGGYWLQSPYIDLSPYAGQTIQVRFRFDTIDAASNGHPGWGIDDLIIFTAGPAACSPGVPLDDSPTLARPIAYGDTLSAEICPPGDMDYYRFTASAGDRIVVDINAHASGSALDAIVYLFDSDGISLLAEHDDRVYAQELDPLLTYSITRSGEYYLMVKAWNHPGQGDPDHFYSLSFYEDSQSPSSSIVFPQSSTHLPVFPFTVAANAADTGSGIDRVEFYWHSWDWLNSDWELLGVDATPEDGWKMSFDPGGLGFQSGAAFYVRAYDVAGNSAHAASWNLLHNPDGPTIFLPIIPRQTE